MSSSEKPTAAYALSLIAGVLILLNGAVIGFVPGLIAAIPGASAVPGFVGGILWTVSIVILVFGVIVLLSAVMLYQNPMRKTTWGVLILLFSILSIVGGGGFLVGTILGIIGGALALAWKPSTSTL